MRKPNEVKVYKLGHFEAMQISLALDVHAQVQEVLHPGQAEATRGLRDLFSSPNTTVTVLVEYEEE